MSNKNLPHWDLTPIYKGVDTPDFLADLEKVVTLSNKLKSDIEEHKPLFDVINLLNEIITIGWTLNSYANAILTTDTSNGAYIKAVGNVEEALLKFKEADDLFVSKIKDYQNEFSDPRLKQYSYILNEYLEDSNHQMSLAEEALASDLARSGVGAFERLYDSVSSSICDNDKTVIQLRNDATNPNRDIRKASYEREKKVWAEHEVAFAACLNSIKAPSTLNNISNNVFSSCQNLVDYDFTDCEQIPTITATSFPLTNDASHINLNSVISVPRSLYQDWVREDLWETLKKYIYGGQASILNFTITPSDAEAYVYDSYGN